MRVAIVSDSHNNITNLEKAVARANGEGCEQFFHLGDLTTGRAADTLAGFQGGIRCVFGNCDTDIQGLKRSITCVGGEIDPPPFSFKLSVWRILLLHEPFGLEHQADTQSYDYIFYGHLHRLDQRRVGKTSILNPGESGSRNGNATLCIADLASGQFDWIYL